MSYKSTIRACFVGYIVQAIVNNFAPLLFSTFQSQYGIPLSQITTLITINFALQLVVDLLSVTFVDRIGYRASLIIAHAMSVLGIVALTILPEIFSNAYYGILVAVVIYAIGGGLLEVLVSPVVESCPTDNKETVMSLLHSFYCWGHVAVVLVSTIFFAIFGTENWKVLAIIWAVLPFANMFVFSKVPIYELNSEGEKGLSVVQLMKNKFFWLFFIIMFSAGASEQSISQWASIFAEEGLNVTKTVGDIAGPMAFAILMGTSRALYGKFGERVSLNKLMIVSSALCIAMYILIGVTNSAAISLVCCALSGFSVGIMWPGAFSKASSGIKGAGTSMFALLALAGDLGCSLGPTLVGEVADALNDNLHYGILTAVIFPILLLVGMIIYTKSDKENTNRLPKKEI